MYAGRCVEYGPVDSVLRSPRHPYTGGLLAALPTIELALRQGKPVPITGQPPDLTTLPPGCSFAPRCPFRERRCDTISMELDRSVSEHGSACPFVDFAAVSRPDASAGAVR
jgi:oligopeptide/dipeptide ABC transporter ATP-binding protein